MSNFIHLQCENHDPPLTSDIVAKSPKPEHMEQLRTDLIYRDALVNGMKAGLELPQGWDHRIETITFLMEHPDCKITIRDENGEEHNILGDIL